jgi:hypothetical protein
METVADQFCFADTQFTILSRRARYPHVSEANTLSGGTPQARNAVSHASSAKPFALLKQSQLRRKNVQMEAGEPHATILT